MRIRLTLARHKQRLVDDAARARRPQVDGDRAARRRRVKRPLEARRRVDRHLGDALRGAPIDVVVDGVRAAVDVARRARRRARRDAGELGAAAQQPRVRHEARRQALLLLRRRRRGRRARGGGGGRGGGRGCAERPQVEHVAPQLRARAAFVVVRGERVLVVLKRQRVPRDRVERDERAGASVSASRRRRLERVGVVEDKRGGRLGDARRRAGCGVGGVVFWDVGALGRESWGGARGRRAGGGLF